MIFFVSAEPLIFHFFLPSFPSPHVSRRHLPLPLCLILPRSSTAWHCTSIPFFMICQRLLSGHLRNSHSNPNSIFSYLIYGIHFPCSPPLLICTLPSFSPTTLLVLKSVHRASSMDLLGVPQRSPASSGLPHSLLILGELAMLWPFPGVLLPHLATWLAVSPLLGLYSVVSSSPYITWQTPSPLVPLCPPHPAPVFSGVFVPTWPTSPALVYRLPSSSARV